MQSDEIRRRFLEFFKARGHAIIPSASLVPEHDPSVLFTTAGMHPLVPYLLGEKHPAGDKLVNVQKCVRTQDIDEVGDNTHDTFFEMLGNWSLGAYFKKEAITWSHEFLTSKEEGLGLDPARLYITCFEGDENAPRDTESAEIWQSLGVPENRIYFLGAKDNWWSPGDNGPCGPDTEMFYDLSGSMGDLYKEAFQKATDEQKIVEVWNDVFMEYEKKDGKVIGRLAQQNVDTGAGLERLSMVMQGTDNIFATDLFAGTMAKINDLASNDDARAKRIVADHIRTAVFMTADGVTPSNTDRGYVLRRLIRRAAVYAKDIGITDAALFVQLAETILDKYSPVYDLSEKRPNIIRVLHEEIVRFETALSEGLKHAEQMLVHKRGIAPDKYSALMADESKKDLLRTAYKRMKAGIDFGIESVGISEEEMVAATITGEEAFDLYQSFGVPRDRIVAIAHSKRLFVDLEDFDERFSQHRDVSRKGAEQKFKGGLADHSEMSVKYHTATHLLHQALRQVLGSHVFQKGSNITPERLRFDFSFERKMTDEEKQKVETLVNEQIRRALPVSYEDVSFAEAEKRGAIGLFEEKYGDTVRIYKIGDFSLEFCGGPHVTNTSELGTFKITKDEAVSSGVRRIKAVLE